MQEVDPHGNVIPSDSSESIQHAVNGNGVSKDPAANEALGNANGHHSEEKRPSQSQDISLHNLNDFN